MTIRMTPRERANLAEFYNRVAYDSKPVHQWQRKSNRPRVDVLWVVLAGLAALMVICGLGGWVIASLIH